MPALPITITLSPNTSLKSIKMRSPVFHLPLPGLWLEMTGYERSRPPRPDQWGDGQANPTWDMGQTATASGCLRGRGWRLCGSGAAPLGQRWPASMVAERNDRSRLGPSRVCPNETASQDRGDRHGLSRAFNNYLATVSSRRLHKK